MRPAETLRWLAKTALVGLAYYGAARLGLVLQLPGTNASPVWPPSGIGLAALLLFGYRVWPGIAVGAFLANLLTLPSTAAGFVASTGICAGNTLEHVVGLWLIRRLTGQESPYDRASHALRFLLAVALAGGVASTNGATSLWLTGIIPGELYGPVWFTWWLGDISGMLVLTPALCGWWGQPRLGLSGRRMIEFAALNGVAALLTELIFGGWAAQFGIDARPYLVVPVLLWAAFRFGPRETSSVAALVSGIAIGRTILGMSPFAEFPEPGLFVFSPFLSSSRTPNDVLLSLQVFICTFTTMALVLAGAVAERERLNAELERRVRERTAELEQANTQLRAGEERLRLLFSATHRATWDWDMAAGCFWYQEGLGAGAEGTVSNVESIGAQWLERVHPADRTRIAASFRALFAGTDELWSEEYRYRNADASYAQVLERGVVIRNRGEPVRMLGAMLDTTERKRAEEEIRRLNAELEERVRLRTAELTAANQELESFSYSVSHDLRAPLRHIHGFSDLLRRQHEASLDEAGRRHLSKISDAAQQMGVLIDELLAFSRIGRAELKRTRVDLRELVEEVRDLLEPEMAGRDIAWAIDELPEVPADRALLRLVLQNLIANALKYSGPRQRAEITMSTAREQGEFVVSIRDNGVGFDMKYAERLFGVFQRLHSDFEGTGIGLATVRRIILRHGGRVWAEGAVDEGACFYFSLPDELPAL